MEETPKLRPGCTVRKFSSHAEQEAETIRYWRGQTIAQKMTAVAELVRDGYRLRGIDIHAERPDRTVRGVQREGR
jgi:hypothetical protein